MINRNLFKQLILNQEKEQIKQFLQKELQNEQRKFTLNLMPKIRTVERAKFKKVSKKKVLMPKASLSNSEKRILTGRISL